MGPLLRMAGLRDLRRDDGVSDVSATVLGDGMSDLVKQGRFVANFLNRDEMSSVIHAQTVDDLCDRIEQLERELAAEKALADRLYEAARNYSIRAGEAGNESFLDAHNAYRKARGL